MRGWTLYEASDAMDIDPQHLQQLDTESLKFTLVTLVPVAAGSSVELDERFSFAPVADADQDAPTAP